MSVKVGFPDYIVTGLGYYLDRENNQWTPDSLNEASIPDRFLNDFVKDGFVYPAPSQSTANRGAATTFAGQMLFDTTLGRPIWRNATNTGWVFSDGTAA